MTDLPSYRAGAVIAHVPKVLGMVELNGRVIVATEGGVFFVDGDRLTRIPFGTQMPTDKAS